MQIFDNGGPNDMHAEPTIAAARAGKHVICEKPLGRTAEESYEIWKAVAETGVKHMTAFNYRFYPAIRLAKEMIDAGELGEIYHFRGRYHQEWIMDPEFPKVWRLDKEVAGSGALGDLGAHVIDQSRYLAGEPSAVNGVLRTFIKERPGGTVDVDDAFEATVEFENGAIGTYEATRFALGRKNQMRWEINGSKGTIVFDAERANELEVNMGNSKPGERAQGFRTVLVSEAYHPYWQYWWPHGHMIGWEDNFVHELLHLLTAVKERHADRPARSDDGGRLPLRGDLRRDRPLPRERPPRGDHVPDAVIDLTGKAGGGHRRLAGHRRAPRRSRSPGRARRSRSTSRARPRRPSGRPPRSGRRGPRRSSSRATAAILRTSTSWPARPWRPGAGSTSG